MASKRYALFGRAVWKVGKAVAPRVAKRWQERRESPKPPQKHR